MFVCLFSRWAGLSLVQEAEKGGDIGLHPGTDIPNPQRKDIAIHQEVTLTQVVLLPLFVWRKDIQVTPLPTHLQKEANTKSITPNGQDPDLRVASIAQKRCTDILDQDQGLPNGNTNTKRNLDLDLRSDLAGKRIALLEHTSQDTESSGKMVTTADQG